MYNVRIVDTTNTITHGRLNAADAIKFDKIHTITSNESILVVNTVVFFFFFAYDNHNKWKEFQLIYFHFIIIIFHIENAVLHLPNKKK